MKETIPATDRPNWFSKLRDDLQTIMDEVDSTPDENVCPMLNSPRMWMRSERQRRRFARAINAVRLRLAGKSCAEIAAELGIGKRQTAAYVAWNTLLQPNWTSPAAKRALAKSFEDHAIAENATGQIPRRPEL